MTLAAEAVAMDKETFARALRSTLEEQLTLDHPIFKELFTPERNWNLLKIITLEGYQITKYFLEYIENLYFRCPYPDHKRRLLYNLFEEETGRFSKTKNHVELMEDFIRAQGISDEERDAWTPSEATRELIGYRLENCKGGRAGQSRTAGSEASVDDADSGAKETEPGRRSVRWPPTPDRDGSFAATRRRCSQRGDMTNQRMATRVLRLLLRHRLSCASGQ